MVLHFLLFLEYESVIVLLSGVVGVVRAGVPQSSWLFLLALLPLVVAETVTVAVIVVVVVIVLVIVVFVVVVVVIVVFGLVWGLRSVILWPISWLIEALVPFEVVFHWGWRLFRQFWVFLRWFSLLHPLFSSFLTRRRALAWARARAWVWAWTRTWIGASLFLVFLVFLSRSAATLLTLWTFSPFSLLKIGHRLIYLGHTLFVLYPCIYSLDCLIGVKLNSILPFPLHLDFG